MILDLAPDEHELLLHVLNRALSDLRYEIAGTDSYTMRGELKQDEVVLRRLLDQVAAAQPAEIGAA